LIRYPSFDGEKISAYLYLPKTGRPPYPLIVWPHGGPEHQEKAEYRAAHQFWASRGYAVFVPNFRGSTGFGKRFQKLIYKDWGGGHYQDLLAGVEFLKKQGAADARRVAIYGGSFGGYTALWAITQNPEVWKAAVAVVAPANLVTLARSTHDSWRKAFCDLVGDPDTEGEFLLSRSPLTFAEKVRCPLLLFQGANDPRVPRAEAEQFVAALRSRGLAVEYVLFENEGHGWRTQERLFEEVERALAFLEKHLLS
jgi:dipeptidyl aminopeptidase/acylaminoacyl peptidase